MESILETVKVESQNRLYKLQEALLHIYDSTLHADDICIYVCGSLGRLEALESSDLDLFFINLNGIIPNLDTYLFFSKLYKVTQNFGYPIPTNRGEYWSFISRKDLLDIGSRTEDYVNSFTARMLLLLESKPVYNIGNYEALIKATVEKYFVDYKENREDFYPLFLMNDILRYWYTLTLNYEYRRDSNDDKEKRYWKRLKLKFARLITCYSMIACLYEKEISPKRVVEYIKMTPFERLHALGKCVPEVCEIIKQIETEYEWYLNLRQQHTSDWWSSPNHKTDALQHADTFHSIVVHKLIGTLSTYNPKLAIKADNYCSTLLS